MRGHDLPANRDMPHHQVGMVSVRHDFGKGVREVESDEGTSRTRTSRQTKSGAISAGIRSSKSFKSGGNEGGQRANGTRVPSSKKNGGQQPKGRNV